MAYEDFKYLARRTASNTALREKVFNIAKNPRYHGCQRELSSMVYNFLVKKSSGSGVKSMSNEQLAEELHKPIIRKFKTRKVYSSLKDNTSSADLADIQFISSFNKGFMCY